jgi:DNA-binding NtrC family response regulator
MEARKEAAMTHPETKRVLIVEDDGPARSMIAGMVEAAGFEAVAADGLASAMGALEGDDPIDLVITGVGMPAGTPRGAVEKLGQAERAGLKVIYLAGSGSGGMAAPGNDNHVLQKPVMIDALLRAISATLYPAGQPRG